MSTSFEGSRSAKAGARWIEIYEALKNAILSHSLMPGMKLPEDEIGEVYEVSRTIVRSALHALAHDRLVVLEPNRGAFVAKPSKTEAREVFEARMLIEPRVAAMAAEQCKPVDAARLLTHVELEHAALKEGRNADAVLLSARFHETIAEIADHKTFAEFVRTLCSRSALIIAIHWRRRSAFCESHAHNELIRAISANDPAEASSLMTSHLVDLLSGIELNESEEPRRNLTEILRHLPR